MAHTGSSIRASLKHPVIDGDVLRRSAARFSTVSLCFPDNPAERARLMAQ
jgi:hypothetical protein